MKHYRGVCLFHLHFPQSTSCRSVLGKKIALRNLKFTVLLMIVVSQTPNQPSQWNHPILLFLWLEQKSKRADENRQHRKREPGCNSITGYLEHHQLGPDVCLLRFRTASIHQTNTAGICCNSGNWLLLSDRGYISGYQCWISEVISLPWSLLSCLLFV